MSWYATWLPRCHGPKHGTTISGLPLVVRTWNVFHGNTFPPGRHAFLHEMLDVVCGDRPDVVCLQELPVWGLARLEEWSGMQVFHVVARSPRVPGRLGRFLTRLHHGFFRSAFVGQANAVLVAPALDADDLGWKRISDPGREPRVVHAVRIADRLVVAHFHASTDLVAARAELERARSFVEGLARPGEPVVLAGDFNLVSPQVGGYSEPAPGIDHVLVRGAQVSELLVWPPERRELAGRMLSDHAPVEVTIDV
jgi:endonuclease/exonuclease/phosphatase family metal-dependent hydrolase